MTIMVMAAVVTRLYYCRCSCSALAAAAAAAADGGGCHASV
eukprot:COSAG04_NODE_14393_length_570_cov_0.734607_2_plen_40_part_01